VTRSRWDDPAGPHGRRTGEALSGAGRLIVTDAREAPFTVSRAYGATECLHVAETDVPAAVAGLTGGAGADIVIEISGFPASSAIRPC
jgi:threonine dehydrogenase-like Zn-dependent dehydrogenase